MNIIEPGVKLNPNTTKLIHCKSCDATWPDRKIPAVCPHCGAGKSRLATAKEEECESFMDAYNEMLESMAGFEEKNEDVSENVAGTADGDRDGDYETDYEAGSSSADQTQRSNDSYDSGMDYDSSSDTYEPIGYDPDEFMNNMIQNAKVSNLIKKELLKDADARIKETKWALQRAGLPTDTLQTVTQDIKSRADKLGKNIPGYTDLMLKMTVDNSLQRELKHPKKGRKYDLHTVNTILRELEIKEDYWESYYDVAGLAV